MSDHRTDGNSAIDRDPQAPQGTSPGTSRRMPPLGWVVIAALALIVVVAVVGWQGTDRTPSGGEVPTASEEGVVTASPPGPAGAPATPSSSG